MEEEKQVKTYQHFDFVIEEMTEEQAQALMRTIVSIAETLGLFVGGGYHQTSDANYPSSAPAPSSASAPSSALRFAQDVGNAQDAGYAQDASEVVHGSEEA